MSKKILTPQEERILLDIKNHAEGKIFTYSIDGKKITITFNGKESVEINGYVDTENYIHKTMYSENKISPKKIKAEGLACIISMYVYSEVCGTEFADYLVENLDEAFESPRDIPIIMGAIQEFRAWDYDDETDDMTQIDATVNMANLGMGYLENEFSDYMFSDGTYVPNNMRVGLESDGSLELDSGISLAHTDRFDDLPKEAS